MDKIYYKKENFEVPANLGQDFSALLDIISPETWNNVLTDDHRQHLMTFLPDFPEDDLHEKTQTLEMFFMNENFFFGSPLTKFFMDLKNGYFNADISNFRKINRKLQRKSYRFMQKQYYNKLLEDILISRKNLIQDVQANGVLPDYPIVKRPLNKPNQRETCLQRARKRYFREIKAVKTEANCSSDLSDDENYPEGAGFTLNKKQRRQLLLLESSFPSNLSVVLGTYTRGSLALDLESRLTSEENPFDSSDDHMRNLLAQHVLKLKKKKKTLRTDTRGINLEGVLRRAQMYTKKPIPKPFIPLPVVPPPKSILTPSLKKVVKKKALPLIKEKLSYNFSVPQSLKKEIIPKKARSISSFSRNLSSEDSSSDFDIENIDIKEEPIEPQEQDCTKSLDQDRSLLAPELTQETHASFFCLLRDVICSTHLQRMNRLQLEANVRTWQDSAISPLNEWFCLCESWVKALPSAINFLCGNIAPYSADKIPADYVPFLEQKMTTKSFQWIGAGRDSDNNLEPLAQFWLSNRDGYCNEWPKFDKCELTDSVKKVPPPPVVHSLPIRPESSISNQYHSQERIRYGNPHKAFTYRMNGYESVIGPVKGVYTQQVNTTSRARDHTLLVSSRPPYVTILSLVWDAVARLPNGEGTKADICKMLKESQFIVPVTNSTLESTLTSVVSGALDRLQNEKDPCVKFDTSRKLWVYLHCNRTEQEFEQIHHLNGPSGSGKGKNNSSKSKKVKKEEALKGPPNVAMEQFSSAIKQMDGSEVKVKDEDLLKNWVKISTAPMKKKETVKITSSQLRADLAKMKAANAKAAADNLESLNKSQQNFKSVAAVSKMMSSITGDVKPRVAGLSSTGMTVKNEPGTSTLSSSFQFSRKNKTVLQTTTNTTSTLTPVKPTINTQGSRKYQSALEKKKLMQAIASSQTISSSQVITTTTTGANVPATTIVTAGAKAMQARPQSSEIATTLSGIKVLQYTNSNVQGKNVIGGPSLVMEGSNTVPATLVGQKLVVAGNRVLVHSGKILHNLSGAVASARGKQVITGMVPAQHIMAVNSLRKASGEPVNVERASTSSGRFIQIAAVDGSSGGGSSTQFQKINLVSQLSQAAANQQKNVDVQKTSLTASELKLKLGGSLPGNLISLGGKQIFLTKGHPARRAPGQVHQVIVSGEQSTSVSGDGIERRIGVATQASSQTTATNQATPQQILVSTSSNPQQSHVSTSTSSQQHQQIVVPTCSSNQFVVTTNANGQQIVIPSSQINLKRLQAFQSFKVVTASPQQAKGKPMVARILAPSSSSAGKVSFQISSDSTTKKSP